MKFSKLNNSLQTKIGIYFILFALIIINSIGWVLYYQSEIYFDEELGINLQSIAKASAKLTDADLFSYLKTGSERGNFYNSLSRPLKNLQKSFKLKRVYIVDNNYRLLLDSDPTGKVGQKIPHLESNLAEVQISKNGEAVYSTLYRAYDGKLYKSAFAPVKNENEKIVAIACVDASPTYLSVIDKIQNFVLLLNLISLIPAIVIGLLLARTIVNPVKSLAEAAQRVSKGQYQTPVQVKSNDELGFLGNIFNMMQKNIRENEKKLKELSAAVAHEIRNPLNSISLYLGLLKRRIEEDTKNVESVEKIQKEIDVLNNIVEEFLLFSRHSEVKKRIFKIAELIEESLFLTKDKIDEKCISVKINILPKHLSLNADKIQLKRALLNLFINSIQAMDYKGILRINSYKNKNIVIEIIDDGKGIEKQYLEKIFDPFFSTRSNGTGLGLAIVSNIVSQHNGAIVVNSKVGIGTKFLITIPSEEKT